VELLRASNRSAIARINVQHKPSGTPQPQFTDDPTQKDIRIAGQVMTTASQLLSQEQQQIPPYGQNALFLKQQADNLYLSLHCSSLLKKGKSST
jgi:hypothetical protein